MYVIVKAPPHLGGAGFGGGPVGGRGANVYFDSVYCAVIAKMHVHAHLVTSVSCDL